MENLENKENQEIELVEGFKAEELAIIFEIIGKVNVPIGSEDAVTLQNLMAKIANMHRVKLEKQKNS